MLYLSSCLHLFDFSWSMSTNILLDPMIFLWVLDCPNSDAEEHLLVRALLLQPKIQSSLVNCVFSIMLDTNSVSSKRTDSWTDLKGFFEWGLTWRDSKDSHDDNLLSRLKHGLLDVIVKLAQNFREWRQILLPLMVRCVCCLEIGWRVNLSECDWNYVYKRKS